MRAIRFLLVFGVSEDLFAEASVVGGFVVDRRRGAEDADGAGTGLDGVADLAVEVSVTQLGSDAAIEFGFGLAIREDHGGGVGGERKLSAEESR